MLAIEIPGDIEGRICQLAREAGQSEADYVLNLLLEHIADLDSQTRAPC